MDWEDKTAANTK